jgi:hypothetical protein
MNPYFHPGSLDLAFLLGSSARDEPSVGDEEAEVGTIDEPTSALGSSINTSTTECHLSTSAHTNVCI